MATTAKLFKSGRSQAVRLPREFRFAGKEVRITRFGSGVLLQPIDTDLTTLFAALDKYDEPFMPEGRPPQPPMQERPELDKL